MSFSNKSIQINTKPIITNSKISFVIYIGLLGVVFTLAHALLVAVSMAKDEFGRIMSASSFLSWHSLFEFTSILVCLCIFMVAFFTYQHTQSLRTIFLGSVFLAVGLLDFFHTLSYKGMPIFFTNNIDANRPTTLWIISSYIFAIGFLVSVFIPLKKKCRIFKGFYFIAPMIVSLTILIIVTWYPEMFPAMYVEGSGLTGAKILSEYFVIALFAITMIKYLHEFYHSRDFLIYLLALSMLLNIFSHLAFTSYGDVYDIINYLGHIYKFLAVFVIFRVIFIYQVQKPYKELFFAREKLNEYVSNLDNMVIERTAALNKVNSELEAINERLLSDLEYARDIQRAMLPASLPNRQEVSFDARYYPAERVSGDFYNIFKLDDENIGLYIGDVSGHGVSAAMLTVFLNQSIEPAIPQDDGTVKVIKPSKVLKGLYAAYNQTNFKDDVYLVMFYATYNYKTHRLTYSSAGMNVPPLILKKSGLIGELHVNGFPICKFLEFFDAEYADGEIKLESGDRILFYTDGLTDASNKSGDRFTQKRLEELLSTCSDKSCSAISDIVANSVFDFVEDSKTEDDVTFFMMEVH